MSINNVETENLTLYKKITRIPHCDIIGVVAVVSLIFGLTVAVGCVVASGMIANEQDVLTHLPLIVLLRNMLQASATLGRSK